MNIRKGSVTFNIESHTAFCAVLKQSGVAVCFNTNSKELHVILREDKNIEQQVWFFGVKERLGMEDILMNQLNERRTDRVSKKIAASPSTIYQAILNPDALVSWLPPEGMRGEIEIYEPWESGEFQISLTYLDPEYSQAGKTEGNKDVSQGTFTKLIKDKQVVTEAAFESDDPTLRETMGMTWNLETVPSGTKVEIVAENVPSSIDEKAHIEGLSSSLTNLAAYISRNQ